MDNITIIIPAFKDTYLRQTLDSLVEQRLENCTIYLFDDCSPYNIEQIFYDYSKTLPILYHRFEENLGGKNLAEHWNRCLRYIKKTDWVWLFSDDDIMCKGCYEATIHSIERYKRHFDVFHINGDVVDNDLNVLHWKSIQPFPQRLTPDEYIGRIISAKDNTWGVNFVVRYETMIKKGGFVILDLAWNSDRASWLNFSFPNGIYTIGNAKILWRYSGENISALKKNMKIQKRKAHSRIEFFKWLNSFVDDNNLHPKIKALHKMAYILRCFKSDLNIGIADALYVAIKSFRHLLFL